MSRQTLEKYRREIEEKYITATPKSKAMLETSRQYVSGGVTRETCWWRPHPMFIEGGEGYNLYDIDNNELVDFNNNFTAAYLGHRPPEVIKALEQASTKAMGAGASTESIHILAKILCNRFSSVDKVRFCCSGTEAVMFACRAARAYTSKNKIIKQTGCYHGTFDAMEADMPGSQRGLPTHAGADMIYLDISDLEATEQVMRENQNDLAGILVNPIWFRKDEGKLKEIQAMARKYGALFIVDEVMSFRYGTGGAQEFLDIEADITAFGKIIGGGGLGIGAFGGRDDIMKLFSFIDDKHPVHQSGTFAGNPLTVACGIATLEAITPEVIKRVNDLGYQLRNGFQEALTTNGIRGFLTGEASLALFGLGSPSKDPRRSETSPTEMEISRLFGLELLNQGLFTPANGMIWALSTPMDKALIQSTCDTLTATLAYIKPLIEIEAPSLLA